MQVFIASTLFNLTGADSVGKNPSYRDGWECKHNMYCLKADGLELIKYDEPSGQSYSSLRISLI